jgi:hypothetical protein
MSADVTWLNENSSSKPRTETMSDSKQIQISSLMYKNWLRASKSATLVMTVLFSFAATCAVNERNDGIDYRFGFGFRSVPIGAAAYGEAGFNKPVWGEWQKPEAYNYGFLRPVVRWTSSLTINTFDLALEFHPISFLTFSGGRSFDYRSSNTFTSVDCSRLQCDGLLRSDFGSAAVLLGGGRYFISSEITWSDVTPSNNLQSFYEEGYAVIGLKGHDRLFSQAHTIGVKLRELPLSNLIAGINVRRTEAQLFGGFSQRASFIAAHDVGDFRISYAVGLYQSAILPATAFTLGFQIDWFGLRGLKLN